MKVRGEGIKREIKFLHCNKEQKVDIEYYINNESSEEVCVELID